MSPKPDIMTVLENARPAHLDPDPDPARRQRDLTRALGESAQLAGAGRRRVIRPTRIIYGLTAAAAVAAIAVATTGQWGSTTTPPSAGPGTAVDSKTGQPAQPGQPVELSASQILLVAAEQVRTAPTAGRYWRSTTDLYSLELAGPTKDRYVIRSGDREQSWVARSDADPSWFAHKGLGRRPLSAADRDAWKRDGAPTTFAGSSATPTKWTVDPYNPDGKVFFIGHELSMREVRALPSDPAGLRAFLLTDLQRNLDALKGDKRSSAPTPDEWIFSTATDLLTLPVTPQVRASAYQIMAELSGVRSVGQVKDVTGRTGNAVAVLGNNENGQFEQRIIISPQTGLMLANETRYLKPAGELSWLKPTDVYQTSVATDIGWTNDKPPARTKYVPSGEGVG